MEFSRMGKYTIKCKITEKEISDMGYTLDEIIGNGERTQEFMNNIFALAERELDMKFELGIKSVRADLLSDHTLTLTFSEHPVSGTDMMDHLKDIVNGLLNSIPQAKIDEIVQKKEAAGENADANAAAVSVEVLLKFYDMESVIRFSKQVPFETLPYNTLYKHNNEFFMYMDLSDFSEQDVLKLSMITDEYASEIIAGAGRIAFLEEHGEVMIRESAIETFREL